MATFMIGIQRSGSNLLRLILNQSQEICAPHPPHILDRFLPLVSSYGNLEIDRNFAALVNDVCRLVELNPVTWDGFSADADNIALRCRQRSLLSVFEVIYDTISKDSGKVTWCCKSLANVKYLEEIDRHFTDAKFIYLYRDGRDMALSFQKAIVGEKHFYHNAKKWAKAQRQALAHEAKVGARRFFRVRYEDLIQKPETTVSALCEFLNIPFTSSLLDYFNSREASKAASSSRLWANVTQSIIGTNSGKFAREAKEKDIQIFESVAGDMLDALGYPRMLVFPGDELSFTSKEIESFNKENAEMKELVRSRTDPEDIKRRNAQLLLISEIEERPILSQ